MSAQDILFYVGIAAIALAVAFAALAVHTFRKEDIRAVMDDLSGKTRQRGIDASGARATARPARSQGVRRERKVAKGGLERAKQGGPAGGLGNDDVTDVFDAAEAPTGVLGQEDAPTGVLQTAGQDSPTSVLGGQDVPTTVLATSVATEEGIDDATTILHPGFVVTRSDVRAHSETVIPIDWENA